MPNKVFSMVRLCLFMLVLAWAVIVPGPESLQASCGDWLAHPDAPTEAGRHEVTSPPATPPPCQGPNCGRSPDAPVPTPPPVVERHSDSVAFFAGTLVSNPAARPSRGTELNIYLPVGCRLRIDRPPIALQCAAV